MRCLVIRLTCPNLSTQCVYQLGIYVHIIDTCSALYTYNFTINNALRKRVWPCESSLVVSMDITKLIIKNLDDNNGEG